MSEDLGSSSVDLNDTIDLETDDDSFCAEALHRVRAHPASPETRATYLTSSKVRVHYLTSSAIRVTTCRDAMALAILKLVVSHASARSSPCVASSPC